MPAVESNHLEYLHMLFSADLMMITLQGNNELAELSWDCIGNGRDA